MSENPLTRPDGLPLDGVPAADQPEEAPRQEADGAPETTVERPEAGEPPEASSEPAGEDRPAGAEPVAAGEPGGEAPASEEPASEAPSPEEPPAPGDPVVEDDVVERDPVAASDPATDDDAVGALRLVAEGLGTRLEESQRLLARQTDLADRLHAENQRLRQGELRAAQLPLVRDLLRLHDDIGRLAAVAEADAGRDLEIVGASLLDTLARNGVNTVAPEPGTAFDARRHSVAAAVPTGDGELDRCIAETVRAGFAWDDDTFIRAAEVRVHKFEAPAEEAAHDNDTGAEDVT